MIGYWIEQAIIPSIPTEIDAEPLLGVSAAAMTVFTTALPLDNSPAEVRSSREPDEYPRSRPRGASVPLLGRQATMQ